MTSNQVVMQEEVRYMSSEQAKRLDALLESVSHSFQKIQVCYSQFLFIVILLGGRRMN